MDTITVFERISSLLNISEEEARVLQSLTCFSDEAIIERLKDDNVPSEQFPIERAAKMGREIRDKIRNMVQGD